MMYRLFVVMAVLCLFVCPGTSNTLAVAASISNFSMWTIHTDSGDETRDMFVVAGSAPWDFFTRVTGPNGYDEGHYGWWGNFVKYNYKFGMYYDIKRWDGNPINDGEYTVELYESDDDLPVDTDTVTDYSYNPIDLVDITGADPADGAYLNATTYTFSWGAISDETATPYYRIVIEEYSHDMAAVVFISDRSTETSVLVPDEGYLQPGESYKWRVEVFDAATGPTASNVSYSDWSYFSTGSSDPAVSPLVIDQTKSFVRSRVRTGDRTFTQMGVFFTGPAPQDASVQVYGPLENNPTTYDLDASNYYQDGFFNNISSQLVDGTYTFTVTDSRPGSSAPQTFDKTLQADWSLGLINEEDVHIDHDTYLDTDRPTITWQPNGAPLYQLRIFSVDWQEAIYQTGTIAATQVTVPADNMRKDTAYWLRVETWDNNGNRGSGDAIQIFVANDNDPASLSGTISAGSSNAGGPIYVVVRDSDHWNDGNSYGWTVLSEPGDYTIHNVPRETNLYLHVAYDVDNSESLTVGDYLNFYSSDPQLYNSTPINLPAEGGTLTGYDVALNNDVDAASVNGSITCENYESGSIFIGAFEYENDPPVALEELTSCPSSYTINNLPIGGRFFINAFWDVDDSDGEGIDGPQPLDHVGSSPDNPVFIASGGHTGIDVNIQTNGKIVGTVQDSGGSPISNLHLYIEDAATGNYIEGTNTDDNGLYYFDVEDGNYDVIACPSCSEHPYVQKKVTNVSVTDPNATLVDFTLSSGQIISGYVTAESDSAPIEGLWVDIHSMIDDTNWSIDDFVDGSYTDSEGYYEVRVGQGTYRVQACASCDWLPYANECFDNKDWDNATPVIIVDSDREINFELAGTGTITGYVMESDGTTPIANMVVDVNDYSTDDFIDWATTDANGFYEIYVPQGTYKVLTCAHCNSMPYVNEYYNNTDRNNANPVEVTEDTITPNINFDLEVAATISGYVMESNGTTPINNMVVDANAFNTGDFIASGTTDENGYYEIYVPSGSYKVKTCASCENLPYVDEHYDNTDWNNANEVPATQGNTTENISFILDTGGNISGYIYEQDGTTPVDNLHIYFDNHETGQWEAGVNTDPYGFYSINLRPGRYDLIVCTNCSNHPFMRERLDNILVEDQTTVTHNFNLSPGATISGTVFKQDTGTPMTGIDNIYVSVFSGDPCGNNEHWGSGEINTSTGEYTITGLPTGEMYIRTETGCNFYIDQTYDNDTSTPGDCENLDPIPITTAGEVITGKDFSLVKGGMISGNITELDGSTVIPWLHVTAHDATTMDFASGANTDDNGDYCLKLDAGSTGSSYKIEACASCSGPAPYIDEYYNNKFTWATAENVNTSLDVDTTGIDFSLTEIVPGDIDGDADVDLADLIRSLQIIGGLPLQRGQIFATGDTDGDGAIGMTDTLYILQNL